MCDFLNAWESSAVQLCFDHFVMPKNIRPFATQLCEGVLEHLSKIDAKLTCASEHWSLTRMGRVDRTILRVASFEILFLEEIPINVAINEAIEIAKRYGSEESPQFVNGVLDRVASMARPKQARPKLEIEVIAEETAEEPVVLPAAALATSGLAAASLTSGALDVDLDEGALAADGIEDDALPETATEKPPLT